MSQKIAVLIIHGVGAQKEGFGKPMEKELKKRFAKLLPSDVYNPENEMVVEPVYWAPVLQNAQDELWANMREKELDFRKLRQFLIDFAADAIAYQPLPVHKKGSAKIKVDRAVYDKVHVKFAAALKKVARQAGDKAPLCIIAHSLGTVIASNYIYDLCENIVAKKVTAAMSATPTPLEKGNTLTLFYTMGSPLAMWSLRYKNFGSPISVPAKQLKTHYPSQQYPHLVGEWTNFYDRDDVIAYPLQPINKAYGKAIKEDRQVNVGGIVTSWNPASHTQYWTDNDITIPIATKLAATWNAVNQ